MSSDFKNRWYISFICLYICLLNLIIYAINYVSAVVYDERCAITLLDSTRRLPKRGKTWFQFTGINKFYFAFDWNLL